jgi:hypothetical protein
MTSPGQDSNVPAPNPTVLAKRVDEDAGQAAEHAISEALVELDKVRDLPVPEHVERFEAVHAALTDALNKAENLLSGSSGHGS